ncbi:MAG: dUTP diphosphatase [Alloprevotella sp.]
MEEKTRRNGADAQPASRRKRPFMPRVTIGVKRMHKDAVIPSYAKPGDAGMDLTAVSMTFDGYGNVWYHFGIALEIPRGYVGLIFPRSSLSSRPLCMANCVGVIDSGYRGEVSAKFKPSLLFGSRLIGHLWTLLRGREPHGVYQVGERIAQLVILPCPQVSITEKLELSQTERGDGGYGSTGAI